MSNFDELEDRFSEIVKNASMKELSTELSALQFDCDHIIMSAENFDSYVYIGDRVGGLYPEFKPNKLWVRRFDVKFHDWAYNEKSNCIMHIPIDLDTNIMRQRENVTYHKNKCLSWAKDFLRKNKNVDYVRDIKRCTDQNSLQEYYHISTIKLNGYPEEVRVRIDDHDARIDGLYDTWENELNTLKQMELLSSSDNVRLSELPISKVFEVSKKLGLVFKFFTDVWFYQVKRSEVIGF